MTMVALDPISRGSRETMVHCTARPVEQGSLRGPSQLALAGHTAQQEPRGTSGSWHTWSTSR
jgi:hypothetical protein